MNKKFFQLKPRLKKDIKEKVFEAKAIFEVKAKGQDREMKAEAEKCFRDALFQPRLLENIFYSHESFFITILITDCFFAQCRTFLRVSSKL